MAKPKYKVGQTLTITEQFRANFKKHFKKEAEANDFKMKVKKICVTDGYQPIYIFQTQQEGQYIAYAENFLQPV